MKKGNYQQKQDQPRNRRRQEPQRNRDCKFGFACQSLATRGRCDFDHGPDHHEQAQAFQRIKAKGSTIVTIKQDQEKGLTFYLQCNVQMPVAVKGFDDNTKNAYYQAKYLDCKNNRLIIEKVKQLGKIGDPKLQLLLLRNQFPPVFRFDQRREPIQKGRIKIDANGFKYLKIEKNQRKYFTKVNEKPKDSRKPFYPIMNQSLVEFSCKGKDNILIHSVVKYEQDALSGILQVNNRGILQFIPRDPQVQFMIPISLPADFIEDSKIKQLEQYSLIWSLKHFRNNKPLLRKINTQLSKYIARGYFQKWPLCCQSPLVQLQGQIIQRNLLNMKEAIIFEKGLNGKKFDKKQIKQAQKIVEKFKKDNKAPTKKGKQLNDAQQAEQKQQKLFTFTIDASGTKSRDDALSIQQVQQGVYSVGVHISDVAYHVKRHSYLDQQARNRDGTLYVKNYYFPMLPDILTKDFLSLKANQQKMTYSLFFQMSKQGFINMSQCQIRQTISKVDRNLTHKQADQIIKSYQQKKSKDKDLITAKNLAILNEIMKNRKLIDQNECLQTGFQSQKIVSQAMSISSYLVGFILENNIQRISDYKQKVGQHVQMQVKDNIDHLDSIQKDVSTLQSVRRKVKDAQSKLAKIKRQMNKKVEQETRRIKRQYKAIKNQEKQQLKNKRSEQKRQRMGKLGRNSLRGNQSQSQTSLSQQSDSQLQKQDKKTVFEDFEQTKQIEQNFEDILKEAVQQKVRQQKQPKKAKQKKEESSEPESQDSVIDQQTQNRLKRQAAEGGKKYLERIFKHFEIELKWSSSKEIEGAFQKILKMNKTKSKLYQQYFERMQIMNRQHYKYIVINQRKNQQKKQNVTQMNDTRKTNNERKKQGKFDKQNKDDKKEVFQKQQSIKNQLDMNVQTSQKHSNKSKRSENYKSQKLNEKVSKNYKGNFTQKLKQKNQPNYAKDQVQLMLRKYILPTVKKFQHKQMAQKILNQVKKNAEKQKSIIPLQASQIEKSTINIPSKFLPKMMPGFVSKPEQSIKLKQQQGSHTQLALVHVNRQVNKISQVKVNEPSQIKHNLNDQIQTKQLAQKNEQNLTIKKTKIVDQMDRLLSKYLIDNKNQLVQEKKKKKREEQKSLKKKQKQAIEALRKQIIQSFKQELDAHRRDIQTFDDSVREIKQKLGKFVDSWRILKKIIQTLKSKQDYSKVEKNFIKIIENISSKIGYKQKKNQLKDVKQKLLEIHPLKTFKKQDMRKDNQRFFQFCSNESNKLKWNNPIRSYSSLETLRIIKEFQWIFQGELHPLDVLQFADQIKVINKQVKHIKKQRKDREQAGQNDRNVKEANREIAKWEFYESIKNKLDGQHTFLNVLPPPTTAKVVKKVYHPILGELDVANTAIEQKPFEQIKGKVKIECHFPLDFSVNLVSQ